jgi:para-aminobenzoate synthetase/4-amino-4-deoxychorismate lyase
MWGVPRNNQGIVPGFVNGTCMAEQRVILDDATPGCERLTRFSGLRDVISAARPEDLSAALAAIEHARKSGRFVAGYFSYELGYLLEPKLGALLPGERAVPLLWFGVFERAEACDARVLESAGRAYAGPLRHEWDAAAYGERFARVHDYVVAGDIYQTNLSFRSRFSFAGDPLALYRALRARSAAAHGAFVDDGERQVLSFSPELFFDLAPDGRLTAKPMKGTTARGRDPRSDAEARAMLAESVKDRAENLMIVDLLRNDLGRIGEIGSVRVEDLFAVESYPTLHTMVSTVKARLKPGCDAATIVRALFPCGSITGAPKIRAMQIIRELEAGPRGVYCGAIGHFAPEGGARFNVSIRTLTIKGGEGELGIGGAVVQDSASGAEYDECLLKARYYVSARQPLDLIETLRWSPDEGFVRRDRHLARMARSAEFFGIPFDRDRALCALDAVAEHAERDLRVRLVLSEIGEFHCMAAPLGRPQPRWTYAVSPLRVQSGDALACHKTSWRAHLDDEQTRLARETGCDEVIFLNERGEVAEGSRTNVFVRRNDALLTPPLSTGILDGCLRRELIDEGKCHEAVLMPDDLAKGEVSLGNSLRGLIRAVAAKREAEVA